MGLMHQECKSYSYLDGVIVGYQYNETVRKLVSAAKYQGQFRVIEKWNELLRLVLLNFKLQADVIAAVPLSKEKLRNRGFNQAALFAQLIARGSDVSNEDLLFRKKNTATQVGKNKRTRIENLQGMFLVRNNVQLQNSRVVLVDDVMSSGTTLEQCAKELKRAGVTSVVGLVLARG